MEQGATILTLIQILAGTAGKLIGGKTGVAVQIGTDLLSVAQQTLQLQSQLTGLTMDEVLAQLHDLPPITLPTA